MTDSANEPQTVAQMVGEATEKARQVALFTSPTERAEMLYQIINHVRESVQNGALIQGISEADREWEAGQLARIANEVQSYKDEAERRARID